MAQLIAAAIKCALIINVVAVGALLFIWMERKVSGRIQDRLGPTRVGGAFGWLQSLADDVFRLTGTLPAVYLREGSRAEELLSLLHEDPTISLLVLGMASDKNDPGPLVTYLTSNMGRNNLSVPMTLVPGQLTEEQIDYLS